jgi:diguanylate cyclase (GGDEF)-like protein
VFAPGDCWALRLGRRHSVDGRGPIRCNHVKAETSAYVCMPVQGEGQVLGLLHVALGADAAAAGSERRLRSLVDRVGPALANLKLRESLSVLALHDPLTGLYNRRFMEDAIKRELHRAKRGGKPVSLAMVDIDHFKRFNDTFGHDAGDFVLNAVAKELTKNVRASDILCRYSGEELAILLSEANLEDALSHAEKLRLAVRGIALTHRGQTLPPPTASFGVSVYPKHGETLEDLLKAADGALYRAKQLGRDQVCAAEPTRAD